MFCRFAARHLNRRVKLANVLSVIFLGLFAVILFSLDLPVYRSSRHSEVELRSEIIRLSREYVDTLSEVQATQADGLYTLPESAYDLKKTLAVLLSQLLRRVDILEELVAKLKTSSSSSSSNRSIPHGSSGARSLQQIQQKDNMVDVFALLSGIQENCRIRSRDLLAFPVCMEKVKWLQKHWKSDSCYKSLGVDGSDCSFYRYLSEIEGHCPLLEDRKPGLRPRIAEMNYDMNSLLTNLAVEPEHRMSYGFIRSRLSRMWSQWTSGMRLYSSWIPDHRQTSSSNSSENSSGRYHFHDRKQLRIHLHLGFLSASARTGLEESVGRGAPLGELVQWTDLAAGLHLLGHNITIGIETKTTLQRIGKHEWQSTSCQAQRNAVDLVFTDITGYRIFSTSKIHIPACKFRILDSFGTQAEFNREKNSPWGGLKLNLRQFYTMFPHSPDNTFLGFVTEQSDMPTRRPPKNDSEKPIGLIAGKLMYMFENKTNYLLILNDYLELHSNVADAPASGLPPFVHNHKVGYGSEYLSLMKSARVLIGLGFPYESPAPLEAISHGLIFLNPRFVPPHGRHNAKFFSDKPTRRSVTSQNPFVELFIGEPYSYLVDIHNESQLRETMSRLMGHLDIAPYHPFEFTATGFLERLNTLLMHQSFCTGPESLQLLQATFPSNGSEEFGPTDENTVVPWPPALTSLRVIRSPPGQSCDTSCASRNSSSLTTLTTHHYHSKRSRSIPFPQPGRASAQSSFCSPEHFITVNSRYNLDTVFGFSCLNVYFRADPSAPYLTADGDTCVLQADSLFFDCTASQSNVSRICPCRDGLPGQQTICTSCI